MKKYILKPRSISYSDFIKGNFKNKKNSCKDHPILIFLKKDKNAHNVDSIVKATKMNKGTIRSMLGKLVKKGLVTHNSPFFAFKR